MTDFEIKKEVWTSLSYKILKFSAKFSQLACWFLYLFDEAPQYEWFFNITSRVFSITSSKIYSSEHEGKYSLIIPLEHASMTDWYDLVSGSKKFTWMKLRN